MVVLLFSYLLFGSFLHRKLSFFLPSFTFLLSPFSHGHAITSLDTQYWLGHCRTWPKPSPFPYLGPYGQNGAQIHHFYSTVLASFNVLVASDQRQNPFSSPVPAISSALIIFHCNNCYVIYFTPVCPVVFGHIGLYSHLYLSTSQDAAVDTACAIVCAFVCLFGLFTNHVWGLWTLQEWSRSLFLNCCHGVIQACTFLHVNSAGWT